MLTPDFMFGSSQGNITPVDPMPLAGFAYRNNQSFTGIVSELYLKAFVFQVAGRTKCLVIADILWWPPELIDRIRLDVKNAWGIDAADLLLHATHTHSAPQTSSKFHSSLGILREEWQELLLNRTHDAISSALKSLKPGCISRYRNRSYISMNRRFDKGIDQPSDEWPEGEIDRELTTLLIHATDGTPMGALVHYACHPTILRGAEVSAEFPGVMCELVSQHLGDACPVGFLQGCSGDIAPMVSHTGSTVSSTFQEVKRIGHRLANDVFRSMDAIPEAITADPGPGSIAEVPLLFETPPTTDELSHLALRRDAIGEWAQLLLARDQTYAPGPRLEIQILPLGAQLSLVAFNAEMVCHYGLLARALSGGTALPCGYSNGMTGYIVTDEQLENGGYEVDESTRYFVLPSPLAQGTEQVIEEELRRLLRPSP